MSWAGRPSGPITACCSTVYQEDWNNAQVAFFDPGLTGELTFNTNGPNYRVRGLETAVIWRVTHGLNDPGIGRMEQRRTNELAIPDRQRQLHGDQHAAVDDQCPHPLRVGHQ